MREDAKAGSRAEGSKGAEGTKGATDSGGQCLEKALERLEEIAASLERGTLDLEASLKLYREACDLHAYCVGRLAEAEREARILTEEGVRSTDLGADAQEGEG